MNTLAAVAALFALTIPPLSPASAGDMSCTIIGVTDGDTMTALCDSERQVKIRLAEIDAPESHQPFGSMSKKSLSDMCFGQEATIRKVTTDRWGRTVAGISCRGRDAGRAQVQSGMAWVYDKYVTDHSLYDNQDQARRNRRGLWSDPDPVPPWEWRRNKRR